jgi:hypothetical protein
MSFLCKKGTEQCQRPPYRSTPKEVAAMRVTTEKTRVGSLAQMTALRMK